MSTAVPKHIEVISNLLVRRGIYQVVLSYYDIRNVRRQKWKSLKIPAIPGNKIQAKNKQKEIEREFEEELNTPDGTVETKGADILFSVYMQNWLDSVKGSVEDSTYESYVNKVKVIIDYFSKKDITLADLKKSDIKEFYQFLKETRNIKTETVKRYQANIHKALNDAVDMELIAINPSDNMKLGKSEQFIGEYYNQQELEKLFEVAKGSVIELHILIASYYGLRRSEVCGLKFGAVDFVNHTITIRHTVTQCTCDGKYTTRQKDRTKSSSSYRTMPLIPRIEELLLEKMQQQKLDKERFGNSYKNSAGYILVDEEGKLILPNRVTTTFRELLKDNGLKKIRFHDLRHSCASLLLANGSNLKEIQAWLGHSKISTTADRYSHLDSNSKQNSVNIIEKALSVSA